MGIEDPRVTLLHAPEDLVALIYTMWHQSRTDDPLLTENDVDWISLNWADRSPVSAPDDYSPEVRNAARAYARFGHPDDIFRKVVTSNIPVSEALLFVFEIENMSISLREQLVRHRSQRVQEQTSYWMQSSRCRDLANFHSAHVYRTPLTIERAGVVELPETMDEGSEHDTKVSAAFAWERHMQLTERLFNNLLAAGVPQDDARECFPMAMTHRGSITINLRNLLTIIAERSCWIAQASLWAPVIRQMIEQLAEKVHPVFREVAYPPCFQRGQFAGCPVKPDNQLRLERKDPAPPCPLWLREENKEPLPDAASKDETERLSGLFEAFWPPKVTACLHSS